MATAAAPITDKATRATRLREQSRTLTAELTELRSKLAHASGALATLNDKRQKFVTDAAAGRDPKPGAVAALNVAIDEAQIPFDGLTAAVRTKEGQLAQTKSALETLEREIFLETEQEKRRIRFAALGLQLDEAAARIASKLRVLVTEDLPAFDVAQDAIEREFIGRYSGDMANPEANAARALLNQLKGQFFDGPYLKIERELLRAGWEATGESGLQFAIGTLRPPR